jgi:hypothetical protein
MKPHGVQDLASLLGRILHPKKRPRAFERARQAWIAAVPESVSSHTRVTSLRSGVLTVEVDSPPLCHQLDAFDKERCLLALKSAPGGEAVTRLRFRHGAGHE